MMLAHYLVWLPAYDEAAVTKLLHPDDPQDVPRAVELMLAIIEFSQSQCHVLNDLFSLEVDTHADLISISLLSARLESILSPFINVSLSVQAIPIPQSLCAPGLCVFFTLIGAHSCPTSFITTLKLL
jgi:hypothetical protein